MEDNIKLSVIIPIYNLENYVSECLDSITKQVKNNVEIIIMDDGSNNKITDVDVKLAGVTSMFLGKQMEL